MCVPAVGAIASVASSVAGFAGAQQDYEAKAEQWRQNYTNALAAGVESQKQLNLRFTQENEAYTQRVHLQEVEGAQAIAKAETSSGNISGNAVDNIVTGLERDVARNQLVFQTNWKNTVQQLQQENEATNVEIQNQINSVQRPVAPNPLGYVASGIGGVIKAFDTGPTE